METKKQKQINVLICDDEPGIRNDLRDHLNEFARLRDLDIRIGEFESAEGLLASHEAFDVLFLDIYLDGMDGTDAAWRLNTQERKRTVFLTSSQDHAIEAYQIGASHYLLKPIDFDSVVEALERCLSESGKDVEPIITVRTTDGVVPLPMRSISMVEAKDKVCTISTEDKDWRAYTTLTALEDQLDVRCFIRVQRSFLVNMRHIKTLYHDRVVMKNGEVISLGRGRKQEVRQRYQDFMFALARGELT